MANGVTRCAVVTGASGAIGTAIAEGLKAQGQSIVTVDKVSPRSRSSDDIHYGLDLTDMDATIAVANTIAKNHRPTTFVHCAGAVYEAPLERVDASSLKDALHVFLGAAVWFVQAMQEEMRLCGHGRIVLIGSRAILGMPGRTAYSAAKAGMTGLLTTWALELAPHGITVNMVSPGPIDTPMLREALGDEGARSAAARIPLARLGDPQDVARAVAFFATEENDWVTGQNLFVCGGTSVAGVSVAPIGTSKVQNDA